MTAQRNKYPDASPDQILPAALRAQRSHRDLATAQLHPNTHDLF